MTVDGMRARRPTLTHVAAAAGVSRATASLVLRGTGNLTEATRDRVRAAMAELGYVYHRGAASMRAVSSSTIGLVAPASSNLFMSEFTSAFELHLVERGLVTLVCHSYEDVDRQSTLVRSLLERGVDGIAIVPAVGSARALGALLAGVDVPVVLASRPLRELAVDFVGPDNLLGGRLAMKHVLEHGLTSVAYLGGPAGLTVRDDRIFGIREEIASRGADAQLVADIPAALTGAGGIAALKQLAAAGPLPEAIICHSETTAFGVYRALRDEHPASVDSVAVIAFDDVEEAALWEPPLTTIAANARDVGAGAARLLTEGRVSGTVRSELILPRLMVRRSCGCRPA